jgi:DNA primase
MASLIGGNRIDTDTLKLAHPIGEVVAQYGIELKRQGRAMVGRCIFHRDGGRPNLYIYADSESWRCYRCGIGGDVLAFIMHAEDIGFREAVDRLTGGHQGPVRATLRPSAAPHEASKGPNERTADELAVLQTATNFYHSNLLAEPRVLDYLAQRGISLATARQYRLGYAADDQLLPLLHWQRLPLGAALHLGLLTRAGHEFMADRIVIPELCAGRPVWLIGRALGEDLADDVPKYLGLPGPKPLLGWDQARGSTTVCVVEGVFDVLTVRQ